MGSSRRFFGVFVFLFLGLAAFQLLFWVVTGAVPIARGLTREATGAEAAVHVGATSFLFALIATPLLLRLDR